MAVVHLLFVERKALLKWYWKYENIKEVQCLRQRKFGTPPPTSLTIAYIHDKFEADGNVKYVDKGRSSHRVPTSVSGFDTLNFYLWGTVKNNVHRQSPATIDELHAKI